MPKVHKQRQPCAHCNQHHSQLNPRAKECHNAYNNKYLKRMRVAQPDRFKRYKREEYQRLRERVFILLGYSCRKCRFEDKRALVIDHIDGGGYREKKEVRAHAFLRRVINEPERYQILCANCNLIKAREEHELDRKKYQWTPEQGPIQDEGLAGG